MRLPCFIPRVPYHGMMRRHPIAPRRPLEHTEDFARFGAVVLLNVRKARLVNETLLH